MPFAMDPPPVQYVTTSDGFSIAYAVSGKGTSFVFMPPAFSHIQVFWTQATFLGPWLEGLATRFRLVQFDSRGKGMSTRGLPKDFAVADCGLDLAAVIDRLGLSDFVLMASTPIQIQVAIRYAIEFPDLVRALVLASPTLDGKAVPRALVGSFAEEDWDSFLHNMAALMRASDLDEELLRMKRAMTQADWLAYVRIAQLVNLEADLARLTTPTLVLHPRDYILSLDTSMSVAVAIPNARLVVIDGSNTLGDHVPGLSAIDAFLASLPVPKSAPFAKSNRPDGLSAREVEVLRLIARGQSNPQIAQALLISVNTVQNHVSSILAKAGLVNRTEASAYAQRQGFGPSS